MTIHTIGTDWQRGYNAPTPHQPYDTCLPQQRTAQIRYEIAENMRAKFFHHAFTAGYVSELWRDMCLRQFWKLSLEIGRHADFMRQAGVSFRRKAADWEAMG